MFKFLKDKLKSAISIFSKKVEDEGKVVEEPAPAEEKKADALLAPVKQKEEKKQTPKKKTEEKKALSPPKKKEEKKHIPIDKKTIIKEEEQQGIEEETPKAAAKKETGAKAEAAAKEGRDEPEIAVRETPKNAVDETKQEQEIIPKEEILAEPEAIVKEIKIPERIEEKKEAKEEPKQSFFSKIFKKKPEQSIQEEKVQEEKDIAPEKAKLEDKGIFAKIGEKISKRTITAEQFESLFFDLEIAMLENNVAVEVIEKIKKDLSKDLVNVPIARNQIDRTILHSLKTSIEGLFTTENINILAEQKRPYVICFFGINGAGKTTSIAKITRLLQKNNYKVVLAASDTFRAAAIDQLQHHADALKVKLVKHDYGADPAAVAYDAIQYAKAHGIDFVLIDTAGRLHSNANLRDELKKIIRVAAPDLKLFVGESISGNDCVEQVKQFHESVGIDGMILSKADIDEKGGAAVSVSYITGKPILYFGTGQGYDDLTPFSKEFVMKNLGLEA